MEKSGKKSGKDSLQATISRNAFVNNQATVVVDVAVLTAPTVSGNQFGDPQVIKCYRIITS